MSLPIHAECLDTEGTCTVHLTIEVTTVRPVQFIDLTDDLRAVVRRAGLRWGLVNVHTRHTTTGILVNEHEPLLLADLAGTFERHAPPSACYRHDDFAARGIDRQLAERRNGHSHCQAALLRTSECLNVVDGTLALGRWQRVLFVELDGGQRREVSVMIIGQGRA